MFCKIWSLIVNSPRGNARLNYAVLTLIFIPTISVLAQSMDYIVGPGDDLYISVWGDQTMSGQMIVGPDGTIMLPQPIGSVYVNQMTAIQELHLLELWNCRQ